MKVFTSLVDKLLGIKSAEKRDALRADLARLEREEDRIVGCPAFDPEDVFKIRDEMADVMDALGWKRAARRVRQDTAFRREMRLP